MRRAQCLFERQGLTVEPFPVDFQVRGAWPEPLWRDPTSGTNTFFNLIQIVDQAYPERLKVIARFSSDAKINYQFAVQTFESCSLSLQPQKGLVSLLKTTN